MTQDRSNFDGKAQWERLRDEDRERIRTGEGVPRRQQAVPSICSRCLPSQPSDPDCYICGEKAQ